MRLLARPAPTPRLLTERLALRPPRATDHEAWAALRRENRAFLTPWEPAWTDDHLSAAAFRRRVAWARTEIAAGRAYPFLILRANGAEIIGGATLEHVRRGAAMSAALGYWLGQHAIGQGYMTEALQALIAYSFDDLDLSRLEAACLPENVPSQRLLARNGFLREGEARRYLQINGVWRDHILYERRRSDRL